MQRSLRYSLFLLVFTLIVIESFSQNAIRAQIDKERDGSFLDEKTYEKARGFIRRDSTYYLGYLLEGAFLFFRANDELGFTKAIEQNDCNYWIFLGNHRWHGSGTSWIYRC